MVEDPRATLGELEAQLQALFGSRLLGLYLFGSLAAGGFYPGKSDIDLVAVLDSAVAEGEDLDSLVRLHDRFEAERPQWRDRIEVLYVSRTVLATFAALPTGTVARISPGEPMHHRGLAGDIGWLLDWHGVITVGETLLGPPPLTLGPAIGDARFRDPFGANCANLARRRDVTTSPTSRRTRATSLGASVALCTRSKPGARSRRRTRSRGSPNVARTLPTSFGTCIAPTAPTSEVRISG